MPRADKTGALTEGRIRLHLVSDGLEAQEPEALGPRQRRVLAVALRASPSTAGNGLLPHLTDRALVEGARLASVGSHDDFTGWSGYSICLSSPDAAFTRHWRSTMAVGC